MGFRHSHFFLKKLPGNVDAHKSFKITAVNVMFGRMMSYSEVCPTIMSDSCGLEEKFSL